MRVCSPVRVYFSNCVSFRQSFEEAFIINAVRIRQRAINIENCQLHVSSIFLHWPRRIGESRRMSELATVLQKLMPLLVLKATYNDASGLIQVRARRFISWFRHFLYLRK